MACAHCVGGKRAVRHSKTGEFHTTRCFCQYDDLQFPVVIQPENSGCAVAAIATVAELPYTTVRALIHLDRDFTVEGTYEREMHELLDRLGFAYQQRYAIEQRLNTKRSPWPCAPWASSHIAMVRNLADSAWHYVVMQRDGRVLDPWWGVVHGLHRYPEVSSITGLYRVAVPSVFLE
jgi:hypothetical protein